MSQLFKNAAGYERATGRFSRQIAHQFVPWLGVRRDARWLDCGCGTGALTSAVIDLAWPGEVTGVDSSPEFLEHARRTLLGVALEAGDVTALPLPDSRFDAVVSGCLLHHLHEPVAAVREMTRVAVPGGTVGTYEWDGRFQLTRAYWEAAEAVGVPVGSGPSGFPSAEALGAVLTGTGLAGVQTTRFEAVVEIENVDTWLETVVGRGGQIGEHWAGLEPAIQQRLREAARATLGEGTLRITAGAWAAKGVRR